MGKEPRVYAAFRILDQLAALREDVLEMASRVEEDLGKAVESLRGGDRILAQWVRDDDRTVNYMQVSIQDRASVLLQRSSR